MLKHLGCCQWVFSVRLDGTEGLEAVLRPADELLDPSRGCSERVLLYSALQEMQSHTASFKTRRVTVDHRQCWSLAAAVSCLEAVLARDVP